MARISGERSTEDYDVNRRKIPIESVAKFAILPDKARNKFGSNRIASRIASREDYRRWWSRGEVNKNSALLLSLENKSIENFNNIACIFENFGDLYKILVVRDIFNLISSRVMSEVVGNIYNKRLSGGYFTDTETVEYWWNHFQEMSGRSSIYFNYNRFLTSRSYKSHLAGQLDLNDPHCHVPVNRFGLTGGSSFGRRVALGRAAYLSRYKLIKTPLLDFALRQRCLRSACAEYMGLQLSANPDQHRQSPNLKLRPDMSYPAVSHWWNEEYSNSDAQLVLRYVDEAHYRYVRGEKFQSDCRALFRK